MITAHGAVHGAVQAQRPGGLHPGAFNSRRLISILVGLLQVGSGVHGRTLDLLGRTFDLVSIFAGQIASG